MGNSSTKGVLSLTKARDTIGKTFSGDSDKSPARIMEHPKTRREKNERHRRREKEFKKKKQERERKTASMQQKWNENRAKRIIQN